MTGYCTSDSLLGLVAFAVDQGMEALATGPLVSLLVFRHKGEPQLMPLWGESWREIDREARKLIADAAEPIDECVVVTHEFGDEGAVAVLAVACERGHDGGGVKPDFGDVMDELAEGFSAPVVMWRPAPS